MRKIYLASTSPRRRDLLSRLNLPFEIISSDYEEDMTISLPPERLVRLLARGKARAAAIGLSSGVIIAADTFVVLDDKFLGKPKSVLEAKKMLKMISGKIVRIVTGLALMDLDKKKEISDVDVAEVKIKKLSTSEINNYVKTKEPMDKAGAFAVQGIGAVLIEWSRGDYNGIVGLPLFRLAKNLKKLGIKVL